MRLASPSTHTFGASGRIFPPRDGFPQAGAGEAPIELRCGGDVHCRIQPSTILIPPDHMVLRDPTPTISAFEVSTSHVRSERICSSASVSRWKDLCR